jgi:hypothetical protein
LRARPRRAFWIAACIRCAPSARKAAATRQQNGDSERLAPAGAMPSNPPRRARRRPASLRQETNVKKATRGWPFLHLYSWREGKSNQGRKPAQTLDPRNQFFSDTVNHTVKKARWRQVTAALGEPLYQAPASEDKYFSNVISLQHAVHLDTAEPTFTQPRTRL